MCFPEGCKVFDARLSPGLRGARSVTHVSITNGNGDKRFASSLLFYVPSQFLI